MIVSDDNGVLTLQPNTSEVRKEGIIFSTEEILNLSLKSAPSDSFQSSFSLIVAKDCESNALVGWFDVEMTKDRWFSTSPFEGDTHWHQTVFPILEKRLMTSGELIKSNITVRPTNDDHRGLHISISVTFGSE